MTDRHDREDILAHRPDYENDPRWDGMVYQRTPLASQPPTEQPEPEPTYCNGCDAPIDSDDPAVKWCGWCGDMEYIRSNPL